MPITTGFRNSLKTLVKQMRLFLIRVPLGILFSLSVRTLSPFRIVITLEISQLSGRLWIGLPSLSYAETIIIPSILKGHPRRINRQMGIQIFRHKGLLIIRKFASGS
jgi:hypothetical protein